MQPARGSTYTLGRAGLRVVAEEGVFADELLDAFVFFADDCQEGVDLVGDGRGVGLLLQTAHHVALAGDEPVGIKPVKCPYHLQQEVVAGFVAAHNHDAPHRLVADSDVTRKR